MIKRTLTLILALAAVTAGYAANTSFTYAVAGAPTDAFGTGKADTYDVAIKLKGSDFPGGKIAGITMPIASSANITDVKVWLSNKLVLDGDNNAPDIITEAATITNGTLNHTFATPYAIGDGDVYVGYSFTVTALDNATDEPIPVAYVTKEGGFYVHVGTTFRAWSDVGRTYGCVLPMVVTLEGDYGKADIVPTAIDTEIPAINMAESFWVPLTITNYGQLGGKDFEFAYSINGSPERTTFGYLDGTPTLYYGQDIIIRVTVPNFTTNPVNTLKLRLTKVNGIDNAKADRAVDITVYGVDYLPRHRPLMEEYTGLWCQYCPRGFAMMEYMTEKYPNDFIGVAIHCSDDMQTLRASAYPSTVPGYPYAMLDRTTGMDPYYGTDETGAYNFETDWLEARDTFTPIDITVTAERDEANPRNISATATVKSVVKLEGTYRLGFYLLADGVSNEDFVQINAFAGAPTEYFDIPQMEQFCKGETYMTNLVFNDVLAMATLARGLADSLPGTLEIGSEYTYSYTFETAGKETLQKYDIITPAKSLRIVAFVVDGATRTVINSAQVSIDNPSGIANVAVDATPIAIEYFDLQGRRIADTAPSGIVIERRIMSDGSCQSAKRIVR